MPRSATSDTAAGPWPATCSATQLGALLGLGVRRIRELAEGGTIPRARGGRYPVAAAVQGYVSRLREQAAGRLGADGEGLDLATERALLARSQRAAVELRLARDRGDLVDAGAVRLAYSAMVRAASSRLRGVPTTAKARIPTLTVRDVEILEDLLAEALTELASGTDMEGAA